MEQLVRKLQHDFPELSFVEAEIASWSAGAQQVTYKKGSGASDLWTILHELGHGLLGHTNYESDVILLRKEVAAWEKAYELGQTYGVDIDKNHVQNCLDTYRDWLHKRSTCPACGQHGVQLASALYRCLNCPSTWKVTSARFCRPYRRAASL